MSFIRSSFIMLFRIALMTLASTAYGATQSEMGNQMETAALSVISHLEAAKGHSLLSPFSDEGNRFCDLRLWIAYPRLRRPTPTFEQPDLSQAYAVTHMRIATTLTACVRVAG